VLFCLCCVAVILTGTARVCPMAAFNAQSTTNNTGITYNIYMSSLNGKNFGQISSLSSCDGVGKVVLSLNTISIAVIVGQMLVFASGICVDLRHWILVLARSLLIVVALFVLALQYLIFSVNCFVEVKTFLASSQWNISRIHTSGEVLIWFAFALEGLLFLEGAWAVYRLQFEGDVDDRVQGGDQGFAPKLPVEMDPYVIRKVACNRCTAHNEIFVKQSTFMKCENDSILWTCMVCGNEQLQKFSLNSGAYGYLMSVPQREPDGIPVTVVSRPLTAQIALANSEIKAVPSPFLESKEDVFEQNPIAHVRDQAAVSSFDFSDEQDFIAPHSGIPREKKPHEDEGQLELMIGQLQSAKGKAKNADIGIYGEDNNEDEREIDSQFLFKADGLTEGNTTAPQAQQKFETTNDTNSLP
jgi:hypothetical protein